MGSCQGAFLLVAFHVLRYNKKTDISFLMPGGRKDLGMGININFGLNYFPKKVYKGVTYEQGDYESLVITIGSGQGDNWWCVLFPPLCLLEAEENTEVEYKFKVLELLDKIFKK